MTLRARPPTGHVAWPFVLVEGEEKAGKSALAYRISRSPHVNRTFVLDLGEGTADEYAELGPYEVLDHDGTFTGLFEQMSEAAAVPPGPDGRPNVIILDDGTVLWDLLKDWASARARQSKKARDALRADPDAEIDVSRNLWNDAAERWGKVINLLRTFPGVGIMLARGKEVSGTDAAGQPTKAREWHVEVQKGTAGASSAWVRCLRPHTATLIGVRHLRLEVPPAGLPLPNETLDDNPLDYLVFGVLGAGGFVASQRVAPSLADMGRPFDDEDDPADAAARADGWADAAEARAAWAAVRDEAERADPAVRRRVRLWKDAHARGQSRSAHEAVVVAAAWFAADRAAEEREPFDVPGDEHALDLAACARYDEHRAGGPPPTADVSVSSGDDDAPPAAQPAPAASSGASFPPAFLERWRPPEGPLADKPVTQGGLRLVNIALGDMGIKGDDRLAALTQLLGRPVASTKDLTEGEARAVAEAAPPPAPKPPREASVVVEEVIEEVKAMEMAEVSSRLHAFELPRTGSNDDRRVRLAERLVQERTGRTLVKDA